MLQVSHLLFFVPFALLSSAQSCSYWLEHAPRTGIASFNPDPSGYQVFRNVRDFGARGDGVTDDTAAINAAIATGSRCGQGCNSSSTTPAVVYFPAGTYAVSGPIIDLYYTNLIGNPNCLPVIKALPNFALSPGTIGIIEGDPYLASGAFYISTNIFWRTVRNFIVDMTAVPATTPITGAHWRTGQATSLENIEFRMSQQGGTQHAGVFIEDGSGGFINDLTFHGGVAGISVGNQQFTSRNLRFYNVVTAINQIWNWGWTYTGITIENCGVGISAANGGAQGQLVGSINLIDSTISNTPVGISTARGPGAQPIGAGVLNLENVELDNVPTAIQGADGQAVLAGTSGSTTISAWSQGNSYTPSGPVSIQGPIDANDRPADLLAAGSSRFYARSKPSYADLAFSSFISARASGATGNGQTDDTAALNAAISLAASTNKVLYLDHGNYLVTSTIHIPPGARIAGEVFPVILSSGPFFNDVANPKPVVQVGSAGETGTVELSDMIISGRGAQAGAIMLEINLASSASSPSGYWDVHTRIGGFAGSDLLLEQCAKTPGDSTVRPGCVAAFASIHLTRSSSGHYLENCWFWVADHDVEDPLVRQITVHAGRGLLDESTTGPVWLVGTGVEHHSLYQYSFVDTRNVMAGFIQTETAYFQPNPPAGSLPSPPDARYRDPTSFPGSGGTTSASGWGLRIVDSEDILIYGAGHYSFFNDNNVSCSNQGAYPRCQRSIVDVSGSNDKGVSIYGLATVGSEYMFTLDGIDSGYYLDNADGFSQTIGLLRF